MLHTRGTLGRPIQEIERGGARLRGEHLEARLRRGRS